MCTGKQPCDAGRKGETKEVKERESSVRGRPEESELICFYAFFSRGGGNVAPHPPSVLTFSSSSTLVVCGAPPPPPSRPMVRRQPSYKRSIYNKRATWPFSMRGGGESDGDAECQQFIAESFGTPYGSRGVCVSLCAKSDVCTLRRGAREGDVSET